MGELEQYLVPIRRYSANPCMDCCCPISKCPWLREGKPVPGWTAKKRTFIVGRDQYGVKHWVTTYAIERCPLEQGKGKKEEQWRK